MVRWGGGAHSDYVARIKDLWALGLSALCPYWQPT